MTIDSYWSYALLSLAGLAAGAINAVAGGGSLISFPSMLFLGIPSIAANATNAVALWPGSLASVWSYRQDAKGLWRLIGFLVIPSILGSLFGAWLLLNTPQKLFDAAIPLLILFATLLLCFQTKLKKYLKADKNNLKLAFLVQLLVAIYGGYFGAGMGIMMLALLGICVSGDINQLNAIKTFLATIINIIASVFFLSAGSVLFLPALIVTFGAIIGGYLAPQIARKIQPSYVRYFIITIGFTLTLIEFIW